MGSKSKSILGIISGKIGPAVLSTWRGLEIVKSLPTRKKHKKSKRNKSDQTRKFKVVRQFLDFRCDDAFKIGFQVSKKNNMTPNNAATSYHLLNAITGESPDFSIDLSKLKFSMPILATENGWNAVCLNGEGGKVIVNWELNPFPQKTTQLDDQVVLVFYDATLGRFEVINLGVQRQSMTCA